jgi:membrane-bound ClpP family serine protease
LVDPSVTVFRYLNEQDQRVAYFTDEELQEQANPAVWKKTGQAPTSGGITGNQADELRLSHAIVDERDALGELQRIYHLDAEPERLQANWAHLLIEQLARPEISGFLLFVAFFALMFELMTPGLGLPGFIAAVCFLLFFWAKVLYGTAGTLEIVLFVGGIAFVCVEIFALPGFGIFGLASAA